VKFVLRAARRQFSAEEKIRLVLAGLCGEDSIAELPSAGLTPLLRARARLASEEEAAGARAPEGEPAAD
jgi:transposase-like protein